MGLSREQERAAWYLAGLFDGEGWIGLTSPAGGGASIRIANTDDSIIEAVRFALDALEIPYTVFTQYLSEKNANHKDIIYIAIGQRWAIERFIELVPFQCRAKRDKAVQVSNMRRCLKPYERPIEKLMELRDQGMTQRAIAREMGIGYTTLKTWSREAGLARRCQ